MLDKRYRIIILGAGFSRPAGLPLGNEIFLEASNNILKEFGPDNPFHQELENFIDYKKLCDNTELTPETIDFEEYLSFLDIEFALGLKGSDTWSSEGNQAQILAKRAICKLIHSKTPHQDEIPDMYLRFAEQLKPDDYVITFNYDILLERSLEAIGKPYRLFPNRYEEVWESSGTLESDSGEVVILKMHGSVDWFSRESYAYLEEIRKNQGFDIRTRDPIFGEHNFYQCEPLVDGPRPENDSLTHIYRIKKVDKFYKKMPSSLAIPWILSPSHSKILYSKTLKDYWWGLGQAGGRNLGLGIIGFSMPEHDEYLRQVMYRIVKNYQESWWDEKLLDVFKSNVKVIDKRTSEESKQDLYNRFSFIDIEKATFHFDGLNLDTIESFFRDDR